MGVVLSYLTFVDTLPLLENIQFIKFKIIKLISQYLFPLPFWKKVNKFI